MTSIATGADDRARLIALLASTSIGTPAADDGGRIRRRPTTSAPASATQQRFWFMEQIEAGNPAYHCPSAVQLSGSLDLSALQRAVDLVVSRHEVLRTTYREVGGELWQYVQPPPENVLEVRDLRAAAGSGTVVDAAVAGRVDLDLVAGPVFRAQLFRTADDTWVLVCTAHHIAFDGWSAALLWRELDAAYAAFSDGRQPELPPCEIQYSDVAHEQRALLDGPEVTADLAFWRDRLAGATPPELPADFPRRVAHSDAGRMVRAVLSAELVRELTAVAAAESTTLFAALVTGLALTIARWSGGDDVVLGTAVLGRERPELAGVIGCLINTVVLRVRPGRDDDVRTLVRAVGADLRASLAHARVPFDHVIREVAPAREGARVPLLTVHLTLEDFDREPPVLAGLRVEPLIPALTAAKFDVGVNVRAQPDGSATLGLLFHTDRFTKATAQRLLDHLCICLRSMTCDPDRPWYDVEVLDARERRTVLETWNNTAEDIPEVSFPQIVGDQAAIRPDACAVVTGSERLVYRELVARVARVATALRRRGIVVGDVVALGMRRGAGLVVGMLGVMRAGAAYVPVDPDYPAARIQHLLTDSRAGLLVTEAESEVAFAGRDVVGLDVLLAEHPEGADLLPEVDPAGPAYVIYTSGSTGTPKGAVISHRGAVNSVVGINRRFSIGPGDVVLALSSPSFDASVYDILGTLSVGATVVLVDPDDGRDPGRWVEIARAEAVTVWHSAPSLAELFTAALEADSRQLPTLRWALVSGDWIPLTLPARMRAVAPSLAFVSLGGATEASVDSVAFPVGKVNPSWRSIPYGRPLPNQHAYVLDRRGCPVPIGVAGELFLGGRGVGLGYLRRPELTAERFPLVVLPGAGGAQRLYRTGDRARFRADGTIELLGRLDGQLKIHGVRVEPGEVEAALREHPAVVDAVAVALGQGPDTRLACCVTLAVDAGSSSPEDGDLRAFLTDRLPAALVPSLITAVDRFPLSEHNKVDRAALIGQLATAARTGDSAPVGELEEKVAAVWERVLGVAGIGRDEDFFSLGGDSYLAIKAVIAVDRRLRVIDLFTAPTVRRLADRLRRPDADRVLLQRFGAATPEHRLALVGIPFGGGSAVAYRNLARALPDIAVLAIDPPGHDAAGRFEAMLDIPELVSRCVEEVAGVGLPVMVYGHCSGVATAVELTRALEARGLPVVCTYLAAALPDLDPDLSLRRSSGDDELRAALTELGAFNGPLDTDRLDRLLRIARHDLYEALYSFQRTRRSPGARLRAPLRCVFGEADPATSGQEHRAADWAAFGDVVSVDVLPGADHYFVTTAATALATLVRGHQRLAADPMAEELR